MELRETIDLEVERLGLPGLRTELMALEQEMWALGRRESELRRAISLWDRWMIFSDTAQEKQLKGGRRRRGQVERSLGFVRAQVEAANAKLGELCPPFAVAVGIAECLPLAYTGVTVSGWIFRRVSRGDQLRGSLLAVADSMRRNYFPDLDFAVLRARLANSSACQSLAGLAGEPWREHRRLGYPPLEGDAPLGRVAERLLDNGFFGAHYREEGLVRRCVELQGAQREADALVGWWDRLNVLTKSHEEHVRDQAREEQEAAQEQLRRVVEMQQRLLHEAMRAYPPLDFYHGVVEALGIVELLRADTELTVTGEGALQKRAVVTPRALLLAAIRRLQESFSTTFPGVPAPRELANRSAGEPPRLQGHPAALAFLRLAAGSERLQALRDEALMHAGMVGQIERELDAVEDKISIIDRLVFWSDTDEEKAAAALIRRAAANKAWTAQLWEQIVGEARSIGQAVGPIAARDWTVAAITNIEAIHTDSGSSSLPKNCSVYKREDAVKALRGLREMFARIYGVDGGLEHLMSAALASQPVEQTVTEDEVHGFTPLQPAALHGLLAFMLVGTSFKEQYQEATQRLGSLKKADRERVSVEEEITLWDRINVFTTTEAEARRNELKAEIGGLSAELVTQRAEVAGKFWQALRVYPPALLCAQLDEVMEAVEDIRAVCRSYTVSTGSGKTRRTETRYRCELVGKDEAVKAMQRWAAGMVRVFGEQLGYHELLEALELEGASGSEANPQS